MEFFKKLISSNPDASSKRFMALVVTAVIIAIAFINLFTGKVIDEFIFKGLLTLAAMGWGAVSLENMGSVVNGLFSGRRESIPPPPPPVVKYKDDDDDLDHVKP